MSYLYGVRFVMPENDMVLKLREVSLELYGLIVTFPPDRHFP